MSEFSCLNLWHENGHGFAEDETCYFHLLVRETAAALRRPRKLAQHFAAWAELDRSLVLVNWSGV